MCMTRLSRGGCSDVLEGVFVHHNFLRISVIVKKKKKNYDILFDVLFYVVFL